ncbi:uncharacterized protein CTRU02_208359 [Colletotrichum truncatum]|uniref:Uncharacterized protein n=1 Tax=Colletotrichum truncatum TaxID=5467 RepID=A0ACC3YW90_COLTU|nr:uncharacterized protein CTRU02_07455 [Colletotrichum truncatum]KAF6791115.1 hypothetical protein CTRU02_07455 [Colletotrichum truncatum]
MCNYVNNVTRCRQCGLNITQSLSNIVYCPRYRNGMACVAVERDRRTNLICCSACQHAY